MIQKQKIIIATSSIFLGLTILFTVLGKNDSLLKNNDQQIRKKNQQKQDDQHLDQKKKKSPLFWICLIIILMIIIFVVWNYCFPGYLSGRCYLSCTEEGKIHLYFCPRGRVKDDLKEQLYRLDIENQPKLPELQTIYADLKTKKNREKLILFGELINNFFKLIDGYLLEAVNKYFKKNGIDNPDYIKQPKNKINEHLKNKDFNDFEIYEKKAVFIEDRKNIASSDSIDFFRSAVNYTDDIVYYQEKDFLFPHYYTACILMSDMFFTLTKNFFNKKENKKYRTKYQNKLINAKKAIDDFLKIKPQFNK